MRRQGNCRRRRANGGGRRKTDKEGKEEEEGRELPRYQRGGRVAGK
jgi:hypothetical protein